MRDKIEGALQNRSFFLWSFRASAGFLFLSVFAILFVLVEALNGSALERFLYIKDNYLLVILAWSITLVALVSICFVFSLLFFHLNRSYRPILQLAWFICVVALCASVLYYLSEVMVMPSLLQWWIEKPLAPVSTMIMSWDYLLSKLGGVFIPTSFSIGGLIFTAVMFRTEKIPLILSCWSLIVWAAVLLSGLCVSYLGVSVSLLLSLAILGFVPWVWQIGQLIKKS